MVHIVTTLIDWLMHLGLINGPVVPHYNLREPHFAKVQDGPQTYILNILWL
jgi:hypothetical protein